MEMHVKKGRSQCRAREDVHHCTGWNLARIASGDGNDGSVFDKYNGMIDEMAALPESIRRDNSRHTEDYCRQQRVSAALGFNSVFLVRVLPC